MAAQKGKPFNRPDLKPAGAAQAYKSVKARIERTTDDPLKTGETLIQDLLHEKAIELSRFANKVETPKDKLLEGNFASPMEADEAKVRHQIDLLMNRYGRNQQDVFHTNESVKLGRRVSRPKLKEPKVI